MPKASQVIGKVAIKVVPDTTGFRDDARDKLKKIKLSVNASIIPEVDQTASKRTKDKLDRTFREIKSKVKVEVDDPTRIKAQARIALLARTRMVTLAPVVSKTASAKAAATLAALSGGRVLNSYVRDFNDFISNLDKSVPKIGAVGLGITGIGGYAASAASNLFAMSQSLAQIGPAALALPGIVGGMAVGLGASAAVLKDFNKVIPEMAGKVHKLQDQMSERFWSKAEAPFRSFINDIFPKFSKGIRQTSGDLGTFFANFANSLNGKLDGSLLDMFSNLNKSILIASGSTDAYAGIITTLGLTGSQYLPRLASWFGDISAQFDAFLSKAKNDGRLQGWIDQGIVQLKALGGVLSGLGSSLAGIARAAERAGGSTLTMMADTLGDVAKVINGDTFQDALTASLMSAHQAMSNIANGSGKQFKNLMLQISELLTVVLPNAGTTLGKAFGGVFDALARPSISVGIISMFAGIEQGVDGILPALPALADGLGALASVVGRLAANLGPSLGIALKALGKAVAKLAPEVEPLIDALGETMQVVLHGLTPAFAGLAVILKVIAKVVTPVVGAFNALPDGVQQAAIMFGVLGFALRGTSVSLASVKSGAETAYLKTLLLGDGLAGAATKMNLAKVGAGALGAGLLAIGSATEQAHPKLSGFLNIAGSAAMGFAVGGPIGAALGAGAGLISLIGKNSETSKPKVDILAGAFDQLKGSLDGATGQATRLTSEIIATTLAKSGVSTVATEIGLSLDRVTAAARGNKGAVQEVSDAITAYIQKVAQSGGDVGAAVERVKPLSDVINGLSGKLRAAKNEASLTGQFLNDQDFTGPYKNAQTAIDATRTKASGFAQAISDYAARASNVAPKVNLDQLKAAETVARSMGSSLKELGAYNITPKILLSADQDQLAHIKNKIATMKLLANVRPELLGGSTLALQQKLGAIKAPSVKVDADTKPAKAKIDGFGNTIGPSIERASGNAGKGGTKVAKSAGDAVGRAKVTFSSTGNYAGAGFVAGILAWIRPAAQASARMAAEAAAAARKKLDIQSPSRVFMGIGAYTAKGFAIGITNGRTLVAQAVAKTFDAKGMTQIGKSAIDNMLSGMESRYSKVQSSLTDLAVNFDSNLAVKAPTTIGRTTAVADSAIATATGTTKVLNYYAAPGPSFDSDEELFDAASRGRMVW